MAGFALIISEGDHRETTVQRKVAKFPAGTKLPNGVTVVRSVQLHALFGHSPYHALLELDTPSKELAPAQNQLIDAFKYLEENFSHVDGFWG